MATITLQKQISGTTTKSVLTITEKSRTSTKTTFSLSAKTNLVSSSGYVGPGIYLYGIVKVSGTGIKTTSKTLTLKKNTENWSETNVHTITSTMEVTIPATTTNVTINYECYYSDATSDRMSGKTSISLTKLISILNSFENNSRINIEQPLILSISQYDADYTNNLVLYFKNAQNEMTQVANWENVTNGEQIQLTQEQVNLVYGLTPDDNSYSLIWRLKTYKNGTEMGSMDLASKGLITNANPIFSGFTYKDVGTKTLALTGNNQTAIKNYSDIEISLEHVEAQKGTNIDHFTIGETVIAPDRFPYIIKGIPTQEIVIFAVDSRGNSTSTRKAITNWIDYSPLGKGNSSADRDGGVSTQSKISFAGTYSNVNFGAIGNEVTATYKYKKSTDSENDYIFGEELNLIQQNGEFSFDNYIKGDSPDNGFIQANAYNIQVIAKDKLSEISYDLTLNFGVPAIAGYKNFAAFHGKYDEALGGTQVWGDFFINGREIYEQKVLWEGASLMGKDESIQLAELISQQKNGLILVFSGYKDNVAQDYNLSTHLVLKKEVQLFPGKGNFFSIGGTDGINSFKYLYIHDNKITGNACNETTVNSLDNTKSVLRYIIGF